MEMYYKNCIYAAYPLKHSYILLKFLRQYVFYVAPISSSNLLKSTTYVRKHTVKQVFLSPSAQL